jgi:hypothetical protein
MHIKRHRRLYRSDFFTRKQIRIETFVHLITGQKARSSGPPMKFCVVFDRRRKVTIKEKIAYQVKPKFDRVEPTNTKSYIPIRF